ncbi:MAG: acyl carrier protein [Proteobacteria bacterium]|nr:acyl carrier protein [Pseudomonadota bacterium]MBU1585848.1 acyl carrier protein [Pseudomonadota bacterium]MBU2452457.1 acyl carrier protein [Pseudomonadota bacterium]MBU2631414.1 acyl carrier protein [Pseudomonadota bacterium]
MNLTMGSTTDKSFNAKEVINYLKADLLSFAGEVLNVEDEFIDPKKSLGKVGFNSITIAQFANNIYERFGIKIDLPVFFKYSTLDKFTTYLYKNNKDRLETVYKNIAHGIPMDDFKLDNPSTMEWTDIKI